MTTPLLDSLSFRVLDYNRFIELSLKTVVLVVVLVSRQRLFWRLKSLFPVVHGAPSSLALMRLPPYLHLLMLLAVARVLACAAARLPTWKSL